MINKRNLWFLTLFSLVLVLSIYYVTLPNELLLLNNSDTLTATNDDQVTKEEEITSENNAPSNEVVLEESDIITALRVEASDQVLDEMENLKKTLTDLNVTVEEKNTAFEQLKKLNVNKAKEAELEELLKNEFKVDAFIKITDDQVRIVVGSTEHNTTIANNIMRKVQEQFDKKMYISVKFQT
ncbi:MAG: SpoIIIAH-like family protein [bacterium]|nr:SpoIIIAH-like family protein [bacterium]